MLHAVLPSTRLLSDPPPQLVACPTAFICGAVSELSALPLYVIRPGAGSAKVPKPGGWSARSASMARGLRSYDSRLAQLADGGW